MSTKIGNHLRSENDTPPVSSSHAPTATTENNKDREIENKEKQQQSGENDIIDMNVQDDWMEDALNGDDDELCHLELVSIKERHEEIQKAIHETEKEIERREEKESRAREKIERIREKEKRKAEKEAQRKEKVEGKLERAILEQKQAMEKINKADQKQKKATQKLEKRKRKQEKAARKKMEADQKQNEAVDRHKRATEKLLKVTQEKAAQQAVVINGISPPQPHENCFLHQHIQTMGCASPVVSEGYKRDLLAYWNQQTKTVPAKPESPLKEISTKSASTVLEPEEKEKSKNNKEGGWSSCKF